MWLFVAGGFSLMESTTSRLRASVRARFCQHCWTTSITATWRSAI